MAKTIFGMANPNFIFALRATLFSPYQIKTAFSATAGNCYALSLPMTILSDDAVVSVDWRSAVKEKSLAPEYLEDSVLTVAPVSAGLATACIGMLKLGLACHAYLVSTDWQICG